MLTRALLLAGAVLGSATILGAGAPPSVADLVSRFDDLRIGSGSAPASGQLLSAGHLALLLRSGRASLVRAGDEVVGLFFEGSGALEYRSVDPIEFPVLAFNLRKGPGLKLERTEGSAVVRDSFQRALWLAPAATLPTLPAGDGPSLGAAFARHREKFSRTRGSRPSRSWPAATWRRSRRRTA